MEQRTGMKSCVKLTKTTIETIEMLKSASCEEVLSRTNVFEWHKRYTDTQRVRMQKSQEKTMLTHIFYAK
jgi:uncharacterized cysteine cluster protein YcgN (CxxCxxCC family)